jgi:hypothetical protein
MLDSDIYSKISPLFLLVGFLLIAHSHNRKNYIKNLFKNGIKTEGKVLEIRRDPGPLFGEEGMGFAPVVEYTTMSGNVLKHYSQTYQISSKYEVGQTVDIWYINYKSIREAALEDDQPGQTPKKLFTVGLILLLIAAPKIIYGLSNIY